MRIFFELWLEIRKRYVVESCAYQKLNVLPTTSDHEQASIGINMASFDIAQKNSQELVSPFFGARCLYLLFRDRSWSHTCATHGSSFHCHFIWNNWPFYSYKPDVQAFTRFTADLWYYLTWVFGVDSLGRARCVPFSCPERIPPRSDPEAAGCQVASAAICSPPFFSYFSGVFCSPQKPISFFFIIFCPLFLEHRSLSLPQLVTSSFQQVPSSLRNGRTFWR